MIALQMKSLKQFMNTFLLSDTFDIFLLEKASITTYNTFEIDGRQNRTFYSDEEWEDPAIRPYEFSCWKDLKGLCFDLIKGHRTPAAFKFVLQLCPKYVKGILEHGDTLLTEQDIKALVITLKYNGSELMLLTGTSMNTFLPDHSAELCWDQAMLRFLNKRGLDYEQL